MGIYGQKLCAHEIFAPPQHGATFDDVLSFSLSLSLRFVRNERESKTQ